MNVLRLEIFQRLRWFIKLRWFAIGGFRDLRADEVAALRKAAGL